MPMRFALRCAVVATAVFTGADAFAHHGAAAYTDKVVTFQASVTEFRFVNPHVQIYFDVTNQDGEIEHWQGELTAPNKLARAGWSKNTIQPGEKLSITGRAARNEGRSLRITAIVTADGESLPTRESID